MLIRGSTYHRAAPPMRLSLTIPSSANPTQPAANSAAGPGRSCAAARFVIGGASKLSVPIATRASPARVGRCVIDALPSGERDVATALPCVTRVCRRLHARDAANFVAEWEVLRSRDAGRPRILYNAQSALAAQVLLQIQMVASLRDPSPVHPWALR